MNTHMSKHSSPFHLAAGAALALAAAAASADVVNYGGALFAGVETSPPGNYDLRLNKTEDNTRTHAYLERYRTPIIAPIPYNAHQDGLYDDNSTLVYATIPANPNATINSYLLHFDPTSGFPTKQSQGWVEFGKPIYVASRNGALDISDMFYGFPNVQYPTFVLADRGYDLEARDWFEITTTPSGTYRLDFYARASTGMDQLRVFEVPSPATLGLLGLGATIGVGRRRR